MIFSIFKQLLVLNDLLIVLLFIVPILIMSIHKAYL